jgi:ribokinase
MTVLVFGSANADLVFAVPSLPGPGETVLGQGMRALPGGKGANQAVAAARDGAEVAFAGCIGRDPLAAIATEALVAAEADLSRVVEVEQPTGSAAICVDAQGRNQIAVAPGANAEARAAQIEDAALHPGTTLLLQMEVPPAEIAALIHRARARGARIILNLAPPGELPLDALRALDMLVVNEHEAAVLAPRLGVAAEASALRGALGVDVAVTMGEAGAVVATATGVIAAPAFAVTAVDTTGAGDCWCGVLAGALDRGMDLPTALRRAAAAAALACTRPGAAPSYPDSAETDAFLLTR